MLNEISAQRQANLHPTAETTQVQGSTGKLIGKAVVQVVTPQSIFQDAMEEMSFNLNKSSDYALKSRKERNQIDRSKERLKNFRKVAEQSGLDKVDEVYHAIEESPERESILRYVLEQHEEPAEAWAALEEARDKLAQQHARPEVLKEVDEALKLMDMRYGAAIRAGICGTLTAAEDYVSLGSPLELGSTYRKAVLEFTKSIDLYNYIQENYGGKFDQAVDFLYASLAADMGCESPSQDRTELESVNKSFGRLRSFQSADALCQKQLTRWHDVHHVENCSLTSVELLGKLLKIGENTFASAVNAEEITRAANSPDVEHRIYFLQELMQNVRNFSPLVFDQNEGRERVLGAVQSAVDAAVDEEDVLLSQEK